MGCVYKITNTINNKCYIGITKNTFRKRYNHRDDWWNAPSVNSLIKSSVKKYGNENFKVDILEKCKNEELEEREKYYIKINNSFVPNGYNLTTGGNYRYKVSISSKLKNSKTNKKRYKNGAKTWNKGKKLSKEHINRIIEVKKKKFKNGELVPWNKGKKIGPMSRQAAKNSAEAHKKPVSCFDKNGKFIKKYPGSVDTKIDGFNPTQVTGCCKGRNKSHKGFIFKYA